MEETKCPCCGQLTDNPVFELRGGPAQVCPECGEENAAEAVMCWACYQPLRSTAFGPGPFARTMVSDRPAWLSLLFDFDRSLGIILFILSGWVPRPLALYVIEAGLISILGPQLLGCLRDWRERKRLKAQQAKYWRYPESSVWVITPHELDSDSPPIVSILNTLLLYAFKAGADRIRLSMYSKGLAVHYRIEGDWQEQMKLPSYVEKDLRERLRFVADQEKLHSQSGKVKFAFEGRIYEVEYEETEEDSVPRIILRVNRPELVESAVK